MNENLIQKAINKDEDAIRQIYNETYKKAYIVAYSFMKDDNLIQDVLQIAYISVFRNLDKLNSPVALQAWINKIVSNTCKNELRKRKEFSFSDFENDEDKKIEVEDESKENNPYESIKFKNDKEVIIGFIDELPMEQRSALVMQIYDGMKLSEIAEIFEVSENTIKSRINYAKKTLKAKIEEYKSKGNTLFAIPLVPYLFDIFKEFEETIVVDNRVYNEVAKKITAKVVRKIDKIVIDKNIKETGKLVNNNIIKNVITKKFMKRLLIFSIIIPSAGIGTYKYLDYKESQRIEEITENILNQKHTHVSEFGEYEKELTKRPSDLKQMEILIIADELLKYAENTKFHTAYNFDHEFNKEVIEDWRILGTHSIDYPSITSYCGHNVSTYKELKNTFDMYFKYDEKNKDENSCTTFGWMMKFLDEDRLYGISQLEQTKLNYHIIKEWFENNENSFTFITETFFDGVDYYNTGKNPVWSTKCMMTIEFDETDKRWKVKEFIEI